MHIHIHEEENASGMGLLLVDASNAFNSVSRVAALWNVRVLWPRCSRFLFNCYRGQAILTLQGSSKSILSKEGITQGDPLSMHMYAIAILPLIRAMKDHHKWFQSWFADDSSYAAKLVNLREWFMKLSLLGPQFGYNPNPRKTVVIVHPSYTEEAKQLFDDIGITVVEGHRFLGGFIGSKASTQEYIQERVGMWVRRIEKLSETAVSQPQAAFVALSKVLQFEWSYLQRVVNDDSAAYLPISECITDRFLPSILGGMISEEERLLFSLPTRMGGLGIPDPTKSCQNAFTTSKTGTKSLVKAMKFEEEFSMERHRSELKAARTKLAESQKASNRAKLDKVLQTIDSKKKRAVMRAVEGKTSHWLTVMPIAKHHFDLSAAEFRDALSLRYCRPSLGLPAICDGCSAPFSLEHALDCKKGGLVIQRHNEVRDALGDIAAKAYQEVTKEPIIREADDTQSITALVADLRIRGVWQPQAEALFDIRVVDTDAQSYAHRTVDDVLISAEKEKKKKYNEAAAARHASFSPFVVSVDGYMGKEAKTVLSRVADKLASSWGKSYAVVMGWVQARMSFAILRATNLCVRGSRTKWRSGIGMDDGAGLGIIV